MIPFVDLNIGITVDDDFQIILFILIKDIGEEMLRGLCRGFAGHETAVVSCLDASGFLLHKHGFGFKISKSCKDHYDWD